MHPFCKYKQEHGATGNVGTETGKHGNAGTEMETSYYKRSSPALLSKSELESNAKGSPVLERDLCGLSFGNTSLQQ